MDHRERENTSLLERVIFNTYNNTNSNNNDSNYTNSNYTNSTYDCIHKSNSNNMNINSINTIEKHKSNIPLRRRKLNASANIFVPQNSSSITSSISSSFNSSSKSSSCPSYPSNLYYSSSSTSNYYPFIPSTSFNSSPFTPHSFFSPYSSSSSSSLNFLPYPIYLPPHYSAHNLPSIHPY